MAVAAKKIRGEKAPVFQFPKDYGTIDGIKAEFETVGFRAEYVEVTESSIDVSDPKPLVDMLQPHHLPKIFLSHKPCPRRRSNYYKTIKPLLAFLWYLKYRA